MQSAVDRCMTGWQWQLTGGACLAFASLSLAPLTWTLAAIAPLHMHQVGQEAI